MPKNKLLPILAITFTAVMWGLSFPSIKISVAEMPPMTLALARFLLASVVLVLFLRWMEPSTRLDRKDMPLMALAGFIGVTAYFFFENHGVNLTTASAASMIIGIIPILTLVADYLFCGNKLSPLKIVSVILSTLGIYLVVAVNQDLSGSSLWGNLLMLGASLSWVVYTLVTRPLGQRYSQLAVVTYQTLFGTVSIVPFALLETGSWQPVSGVVWLNVIFLGLFCSALGYYLYVYAMKGLGVSAVSMFINLIPVVAVAGGYFLLQETVTLTQVLGGVVIIVAVYLATWQPKKAVAEG
ncbi:MAG: DMT family transporter [Clostridia bacterium]|nr:DMT family transporter [Clostridia bacterium]